MKSDITLPVTAVQRFCMHDGPGVRTTVFLKGCLLQCKWCHNPEARARESIILYDAKRCILCGECAVCPSSSHTFENGVHAFDRTKCTFCGRCTELCPTAALEKDHTDMSLCDIVDAVMRDVPFYGEIGGVTLSGGEPMFHGEKTVELLRRFKERNLNTALETSGCFNPSLIPSLVGLADVLLWDIKDSDSQRHLTNTGVSLDIILDNLKRADELGIPTVLRCIILEGINFTKEHLDFVRSTASVLRNCRGVELIAYHPMGDFKCLISGADASFHDKKYIPDGEKLKKARLYLKGEGDF